MAGGRSYSLLHILWLSCVPQNIIFAKLWDMVKDSEKISERKEEKTIHKLSKILRNHWYESETLLKIEMTR